MSLGSNRSVAELLMTRVERTPDATAFLYPSAGAVNEMTWREVRQRVLALSGGLLSLGLQPGQACAILSSTRIEWILSDLAILCAGGVTATIYPASTSQECAHILRDAGAGIAFAEDAQQLEKLRSSSARSLLRRVVVLEGDTPGDDLAMSLAELEAAGRQFNLEHPDAVEQRIRALCPDDLATLIYTSGTTGEPKGVELTHDSWLAVAETIDQLEIATAQDLQYLWLPLSHSFGLVLVRAHLEIGFTTFVDGQIPHLMENLPRVRPTFMAAAPRIFEKIHNRIVAMAEQAGGVRLALFRWAVGVGRRVSALHQEGRALGPWLGLQHRIAERLVFAPLRERFGGRLRFFVSGSAPLSKEVAEFFHGAGLLILEGYGLTESCGIAASGTLSDYRFGTVGRPYAGIEVRLAADGEIQLRGRVIMRGYHNMPEATRQVLNADGWFSTGDIGTFDDAGHLLITDRKKDLIKTSGGKYVAPQKLESRLKALCPYISQVVVHGDNRNYCTALITLDEESIAAWSKERGLGQLDPAELAEREDVIELIQRGVDALNRDLASYETIKRFAVLPRDFSVETGELTVSLKVKRRVVEEKYRSILDGFYQGSISSV